jgi:hypothetical protein
MVKEMEIYQFNNMPLPPYVLIWFPIVHHYLCQLMFESTILHGHEKAHVIVHFGGFLGKGIEVNS